MYEALYQLSHHAPLVIFIASVLDVFFLSGYILYGLATLSAVAMMHMSGMITVPEVIMAAVAGTVLGNQINYWLGHFFSTTTVIKKRIDSPRAQKAKTFLESKGLLVFMIIGRFVTFFRPIHGLILGALNINPYRVLIYDLILSTLWVSVWLWILLSGEFAFNRLLHSSQ
jgi:membrane protein DedA with SNARE-associated domain